MSTVIDQNIEIKNILLKKQSQRFINKYLPIFLQIGADLIAIIVCFFIQFYFSIASKLFNSTLIQSSFSINEYILGLIFIFFYFALIFFLFGLYKNYYERSPFEEVFTIAKAIGIGGLVFYLLIINDTSSSPRLLIIVFMITLFIIILFFRTIARRIQHKLRKSKIINFNTIIVGPAKKVTNFLERNSNSPSWGINPIGLVFTKNKQNSNYNINFTNIIEDGIEKLSDMIDKLNPEILILVSQKSQQSNLLKLLSQCKTKNIRVKIEPDLYHIFTGQTKAHNIYGIPLIEINDQLLKPWQEFVKRLIDFIFSGLVLVIGFPIWFLVGIIIKVDSKGPIFYTQPRIGKDGKVFKIYKFRSMKTDSESKKNTWTSVNDPRVTKWGKFIRKTHLDEIPQFWNVLIGDMSIVGPRPEQPQFVEQFSETFPYYKRRLKIRPGITGWWQVKYEAHSLSNEEIENRLKDDFYYIENMNIRFDLEIIIRTVWVVLKGHGQA